MQDKRMDGYPTGDYPMGECHMRDCPVVTFLWETILWEVGDSLAMAQSVGLDRACVSGVRIYESANVGTKCTILKSLVVEGLWHGCMDGKDRK